MIMYVILLFEIVMNFNYEMRIRRRILQKYLFILVMYISLIYNSTLHLNKLFIKLNILCI